MKILIINPVTSGELFGEKEYFQGIADGETELEFVGLERGPISIETFHDEVYAGPEIVRLVRERGHTADAIVINCFSDPALYAAREVTDTIVLGCGETSMSVALHLGSRFSVISLLANAAPCVRLQATRLGVESRLASTVGMEIPVVDLERNPQATVDEIIRCAEEAIESDGAEVIVLGCTGMATLAEKVKERLSVPVVEPAATTFKMAETLVRLGLQHNRGRLYLPASFAKIRGYE